jgi:hypothetical protein
LIPLLATFARHSSQTATSPADADPVALNVIAEDIGNVPYWGKYIYFRLHRSGRVKYERGDPTKSLTKMELIRNELKLEPEEAAAFFQLLEHPSFLNARDRYPALENYDDSSYKQVISYKSQEREKQIILENYCDSCAAGQDYYPGSIIELMRKIEKIRSRSAK